MLNLTRVGLLYVVLEAMRFGYTIGWDFYIFMYA